jgi:hypothetical protein
MIVQDGDSVSNAIARAQSYFLLCGVISKTIGYAVGPTMLTNANEDGEDDDHDQNHDAGENAADSEAQNGHADADEEMPLLRGRSNKAHEDLSMKLKRWAKKVVFVFPKSIKQNVLTPFDTPLADVAIICTLVGAVLGLVPQLHRAFFNSYEEGGIFNAWLTSSIKNIGKLFTTLQIFIVGCELGVSFEKIRGGSREGGRDSNPGWKAILTIFLVRLVIWPA